MPSASWTWTHLMSFAERLAALRKDHKLTQPQMAEIAGVHVSQIRRYEAGSTQPTLEVLRKIALALHISADVLVFDENERGPATDDLKLALEALSDFDEEDSQVARRVIQSLIMQHQNKRWAGTLGPRQKTGQAAS